MTSLFDPTDPRPLHFVGISGAGMSALALAALRRGVAVSGCDRDGAAFDDLRAQGAVVAIGHDAAHVEGVRALVASAAIAEGHPELVAAAARGVPIVRRKAALAALVNDSTLVAIAGTHGKTTTTVMTTLALRGAGLRPSGLAGGRVPAWGGNASLDGDALFVVEADEYDQAFLTLHPTIAVVNNVEADHLECYGTVEAMELAYVSFASRATRTLVGNADAGSDRVAEALGGTVWRVGPGARDIAVAPRDMGPAGSVADVTLPDGRVVVLRLAIPGMHNIRNAAAAVGVVAALGADIDGALGALAGFAGVGRRFERLGEFSGIAVVDDYAHHPTELQAALAAARQAYPDRRLVAVFQPHLYSRTREHGAAMGATLASADLVIVTDVYGAREEPEPGVTGKIVADAAVTAGAIVVYAPDRERLVREVLDLLREDDVLLTLGAGDVTRVAHDVAADLGSA